MVGFFITTAVRTSNAIEITYSFSLEGLESDFRLFLPLACGHLNGMLIF
jgi:hypothetical protein